MFGLCYLSLVLLSGLLIQHAHSKKNPFKDAKDDTVNNLEEIGTKLGISSSTEFFSTVILAALRLMDSAILPVKEVDELLDLNIHVKILSLTNFNEITGEVNIVTAMKLTWEDINSPRWDPESSMRGKLSVVIPNNLIWRPRLILLNPAKEVNDLTKLSDNLRVTYNGSVEWNIMSFLEASCSVDVTLFPFDTQTCSINVAAWGYTTSEINITGIIDVDDEQLFHENSVWQLLNATIEPGNKHGIAFFRISLFFKRYYEYFMINILLPPILLSVLSPCVFLLPANSGERISFAITCFLAFSVFSSVLSESIPRSSSPVAHLSYFMMNLTIQSCGVAFCTILSLRIYNKDEDKPPPYLIQAFVRLVCCLSPSRCIPQNNTIDAKNQLPEKDAKNCTIVENLNRKGSVVSACEPQCPETEIKPVTWKQFGKMMDYFFFVAFIVCMTFSVISAIKVLAFQS